jgi:hypothetical protein
MAGLASHLPAEKPHLSFVNGTTQAALATLDRVAYGRGPTADPSRIPADGLSQAFKAVAGAIVRGIGTNVFWVTIGRLRHATRRRTSTPQNAGYANLMGTPQHLVVAFYTDLRIRDCSGHRCHSVPPSSAVVSARTARRARPWRGGLMMVMADPSTAGSTARPRSQSVRRTTDTRERGGTSRTRRTSRAVYARVLDNWLGAETPCRC